MTSIALSSTNGGAWDAGGTSITSVTGDARLTFSTARNVVGVICGISSSRGRGGRSVGVGDDPDGGRYEDIEFALYVSHGRVTPVESGVLITSAERSVGHMQELGITLRGGLVTYSVGGVPFHDSPGRPLGRTYARAALFFAGDSIHDAALERLRSQGARSAGDLHPLEAEASNKPGASSEGKLPPLASVAECRDHCRSDGELHPLAGMSAHNSYTAAVGALRPLTGISYAVRIAPGYCTASGVIAPLNGVSFSATGGIISSSGAIAALEGESSDRPYAEAVGSLHPLECSTATPRGYNHCLILTSALSDRFTLSAFSGAVFVGTAVSTPPLFDARGRMNPKNAAGLLAPRSILSAFSGAVFKGMAPSTTLGIDGVFTGIGRASLILPAVTLAAEGTVGQVGGMDAHSPRATLSAFSGGVAAIETKKATFSGAATAMVLGRAPLLMCGRPSASGFAGAVLTKNLFSQTTTLAATATTAVTGVAVLMSPAAAVTALAKLVQFGSAELMMPMPWVAATPNYAVLALPFPTLVASGGAALEPWAGAWAFNLIDPPANATGQQDEKYAASQYTNFPFFRIVRFGGHHYGVSATGLYRLGGETDAGEPIAWAVETTISDFDSPQLKAMPSAYVGAHLGPQAQAKAVVGERGSHEYTYPNVRGAPIQNHRVVFGRGMRSRYYGVRVEDQSGGALHLDSIDLEVVTLTRKI